MAPTRLFSCVGDALWPVRRGAYVHRTQEASSVRKVYVRMKSGFRPSVWKTALGAFPIGRVVRAGPGGAVTRRVDGEIGNGAAVWRNGRAFAPPGGGIPGCYQISLSGAEISTTGILSGALRVHVDDLTWASSRGRRGEPGDGTHRYG